MSESSLLSAKFLFRKRCRFIGLIRGFRQRCLNVHDQPGEIVKSIHTGFCVAVLSCEHDARDNSCRCEDNYQHDSYNLFLFHLFLLTEAGLKRPALQKCPHRAW